MLYRSQHIYRIGHIHIVYRSPLYIVKSKTVYCKVHSSILYKAHRYIVQNSTVWHSTHYYILQSTIAYHWKHSGDIIVPFSRLSLTKESFIPLSLRLLNNETDLLFKKTDFISSFKSQLILS